MHNFIDIHTHILFGVDDGAKTKEESLGLIKTGISEGIKTFFCTPHIYTKQTLNYEKMKENFKALKEAAKDMDCLLYLSGEINFTHDLFNILEDNIGLLNTEKKIFLLEFNSDNIPFSAFNVLGELKKRGYTVIIAHPERNYNVLKNFGLIKKLKQTGAYIQLTTSSITGGFGKEVRSITKKILKSNSADFVASDAHSLEWRTFHTQEAFDIVCNDYGKDKAEQLFYRNQEKIILS